MAVPDFNFPLFLSRLHGTQGTDEWDSMVSSLMREANRLLESPGEGFSEQDLQRIVQLENLIFAAQTMDPGRFGRLAETNGFLGPGEADDTVDMLAAIGEALTSALSGAGVEPDRIEAIIRNITEDVSNRVDETTRRRITETADIRRERIGRFLVTGTETVRRRIDRFVDVPTNEEFLDSFEVSFAGFVDGLRESGLSERDIAFVQGEEEFFLTEFLGDLAARAEAGEDIFKVVGTDGVAIPIGERFGGRTEERITGQETETGTLTETEVANIRQTINETERTKIESEIRQEVIEEQRRSGGDVDPLTITEIVNRRTNTEINRLVTEETNRRTKELTTSRIERLSDLERTEITRERILQRPGLATIFAQSPLDFLQEKFRPASITTLVAGRRGTRQRAAETATGPPVSTPRRVF